jgi:hypothetical protein
VGTMRQSSSSWPPSSWGWSWPPSAGSSQSPPL